MRKKAQSEIVRKSSGQDESILCSYESSEGSIQFQKQKKLTYNCLNFSCEKVGKSVIMKEPVVNREVLNFSINSEVQSFSQLTNRFRAEKTTYCESDGHSNRLPYTSALQ